MNKLVPCPCGKTPTRLHVNDAGQGMRWAHVAGNCCGDWELEFRTEYNALDSEKCYQLAVERWNEAPRSAAPEPTPNAALLPETSDEADHEADKLANSLRGPVRSMVPNAALLELAEEWKEDKPEGRLDYYEGACDAKHKCAEQLLALAQRTPEAGGFEGGIGCDLCHGVERDCDVVLDGVAHFGSCRKAQYHLLVREINRLQKQPQAAESELVERLRGLQRYVADAGGVWPDDDGKLILKADLDALIKEVCGG